MTCFYNGAACNSTLTAFNDDDWLASTGQVGHLFDGLTYLLQAAQEWRVQSELTLNVTGDHTQVYAMDAAFLRARALFEFFIGQGGNYCHARCLFNLTSQLPTPTNFRQWQNELHIGAMHLQNRHTGGQLTEHGGTSTKDLNQMPVDIARGVLDVWDEFEKALKAQGYTTLYNKAVACREKAKEDSRLIVVHIADRPKAYKDKQSSFATLTTLF